MQTVTGDQDFIGDKEAHRSSLGQNRTPVCTQNVTNTLLLIYSRSVTLEVLKLRASKNPEYSIHFLSLQRKNILQVKWEKLRVTVLQIGQQDFEIF